jgi:hypothetical protein
MTRKSIESNRVNSTQTARGKTDAAPLPLPRLDREKHGRVAEGSGLLKSTCPIRTHRSSRILFDLAVPQLH